jgi:oxygen-dependent protoporphyrinogen oxidase
MKNIVVLGAGISGLSLAWNLKKHHKDCLITIVEKSHRPGGWIQTIEKDGFLFELGPRSCRPKGAGLATLQLIEELGLQDQVIPGLSTNRYLYTDQKLQKLPANPISLLFSSLTRGIIPAIYKDLRTPPSAMPDESIYDFFSRRMSSKIAENLVDPMTLGIYAGDIKKLSMKSCFPQVYAWEREHGSIIKGMFARNKKQDSQSPFIKSMEKYSLFSFKDGMEVLPRELAKRLETELHLSTSATSLSFHAHHVAVGLSNGNIIEADHVYSTLPVKNLATLWPNPSFNDIPVNSLSVINLGYKKQVHEKNGFGYLIPSKEKEPILGVVFDSCIFPQQNKNPSETRLTVMMRPQGTPQGTDQEMKNIVLASLSKHLGITILPDSYSIFHAKDSIPQYRVGHSSLLSNLHSPSKHFTILGSSFYGVSVNDCINSTLSPNIEFGFN